MPVITSTVLRAVGLRAMQEPQQHHVRLILGAAVQVDARVDRLRAARELLLRAAIDRRQRGLFGGFGLGAGFCTTATACSDDGVGKRDGRLRLRLGASFGGRGMLATALERHDACG